MLAAQIFLEAGVLCLLLYLVARHEADYSFQKVAMVTAGITVGSLLLEGLLSEHIGNFTVLPVLGFVIVMLMTFCWVSFSKSIIVVVVFCCFHVGLAMGVSALQAYFQEKVAAQSPVTEEDFELAKQFLEEVGNTHAAQAKGEAEARRKAQREAAEEGRAVAASRPREPATRRAASTPPAEPSSADAVAWAEAKAALKVGGVMGSQGGGYLAMVDGKPTEIGDTVSVRHAGKIFRWRVRKITRDGLAVDPIDVRALQIEE